MSNDPVPDVLYGEGSVFRFVILAAATEIRPENFDTAAKELPELTTSDMPVTVASTNRETPAMYGTPASGTGDLRWGKPQVGTATWTISASGNVLPNAAQRANMIALMGARGKYVWIERRAGSDSINEGGCALVTSTGKPVPRDGPVTFSIGLTGYGEHYPDTSKAVATP